MHLITEGRHSACGSLATHNCSYVPAMSSTSVCCEFTIALLLALNSYACPQSSMQAVDAATCGRPGSG